MNQFEKMRLRGSAHLEVGRAEWASEAQRTTEGRVDGDEKDLDGHLKQSRYASIDRSKTRGSEHPP